MNLNVLREEESLIRKYTTEVKKYEDGISLAIGEPYYDVNQRIIQRTKESLDKKEYKYCNSRGDIELLNKISEKENVDINNIIVTNGASEAIFISLLTLLNADDEVIIINPSYPQYAPIVRFLNAQVKYLETKDTNFIPTYSGLIGLITDRTKILILNSPSNPSGIIYDKNTIKMITDICNKYNITILLDDVYESIKYTKIKQHTLSNNNIIKIKSFSKSYAMTGFRLGYIIADNKLINELLKVHSYLTICVPQFIQKAGVEALSCNPIKKDDLLKNLTLLTDFFHEENIEFIEVMGGIYMFVNIEQFNLSSIEFCDELLSRYHIACVPGICFKSDGFIRINFSITQYELLEFLNRFKKYIDKLRVDKEY